MIATGDYKKGNWFIYKILYDWFSFFN